MSSVTDELVEPSDGAIIPDLAELIISGAGTILSPTGLLRTFVNLVFDRDPMAEVVKHFSGDWNRVAQASRAYDALGNYLTALSNELIQETQSATGEWTGDAATACASYMKDLASSLDEFAAATKDLSAQYSAVSVGMQRTAALVNDGLNYLLDLGIFWLAQHALAAVAAGTVVGGPAAAAAEAAAAVALLRAIKLVIEIGGALAKAQALVDGLSGLLAGSLGAIQGVGNITIPQPS